MRWRLAIAVLVALACGQGGGVGGTGSPVAGGGIGGSGISNGQITAFGSAFVTDIEWRLDQVQEFEFEGDASCCNESTLDFGMNVQITGTLDAGGAAGSAERLVYEDRVEGPIASINPNPTAAIDQVMLTVMGQTVIVRRGFTHLVGTTFEDLDADAGTRDVVAVSGEVTDATGEIRATRLELIDENGPAVMADVTGPVQNLDQGNRTFTVRGVGITYGAPGAQLPAGVLPGTVVKVAGAYQNDLAIDATVVASRIVVVQLLSGSNAAIDGPIQDFGGLGSFRIGTQTVDASNATLVPNTPALYANGQRVVAIGDVDAGGVLRATRLVVRDDDAEARIHAEVASNADVDVANGRLTLLGIPIRIDASTRIEQQGGGDLTLADLGGGNFLRVRGYEDGSGGVVAERIIRRNAIDDVRLRGRVQSRVANPLTFPAFFTILGVRVEADDQLVPPTVFEDAAAVVITEAAFYAALEVGDLVDVQDDAADGDATTLDFATEAAFEE